MSGICGGVQCGVSIFDSSNLELVSDEPSRDPRFPNGTVKLYRRPDGSEVWAFESGTPCVMPWDILNPDAEVYDIGLPKGDTITCSYAVNVG